MLSHMMSDTYDLGYACADNVVNPYRCNDDSMYFKIDNTALLQYPRDLTLIQNYWIDGNQPKFTFGNITRYNGCEVSFVGIYASKDKATHQGLTFYWDESTQKNIIAISDTANYNQVQSYEFYLLVTLEDSSEHWLIIGG